MTDSGTTERASVIQHCKLSNHATGVVVSAVPVSCVKTAAAQDGRV